MNKAGESPLCAMFFHKGRRKRVGLNISIKPELWDDERQQIKQDHPHRDELQFQINSQTKEYEKRIRRLEALEIPVTFENIFGQKDKKLSCVIAEYIEGIISELESRGRLSSIPKHRALLRNLSQSGLCVTRFEEIDDKFLQEFELFLRREGNADNSVATKMAIFKAAYNRAHAEGLFTYQTNPFSKYKVGGLWKKTRKRAIRKEDVQRLIDLEIEQTRQNTYAVFARDIFLFSYFSAGINFTDIASLRYCDVVDGRICYTRHKTQKLISFRLVPNAIEILNKYARKDADSEDYIFPILDRNVHITPLQIFNRTHKVLAKVNTALKSLSKQLGLQFPLTTYVARHTYATVLKRSGVNIAIISESLGHSDLSTTQIYLDSFENSQIDEAMKHLL